MNATLDLEKIIALEARRVVPLYERIIGLSAQVTRLEQEKAALEAMNREQGQQIRSLRISLEKMEPVALGNGEHSEDIT